MTLVIRKGLPGRFSLALVLVVAIATSRDLTKQRSIGEPKKSVFSLLLRKVFLICFFFGVASSQTGYVESMAVLNPCPAFGCCIDSLTSKGLCTATSVNFVVPSPSPKGNWLFSVI